MRRERYKRITALRAFALLIDLENAPKDIHDWWSVRSVREALAEHVRHEITKRKRRPR